MNEFTSTYDHDNWEQAGWDDYRAPRKPLMSTEAWTWTIGALLAAVAQVALEFTR